MPEAVAKFPQFPSNNQEDWLTSSKYFQQRTPAPLNARTHIPEGCSEGALAAQTSRWLFWSLLRWLALGWLWQWQCRHQTREMGAKRFCVFTRLEQRPGSADSLSDAPNRAVAQEVGAGAL